MQGEGAAPETFDLSRLAERRPEDVRIWFERYFAVVHGFVGRRVAARPHLAEDVTQETFLVALAQIHKYDPERGAMLPWLTYIARNCARKALRRVRLEVAAGTEEPGRSEGVVDLDLGPLPEDLLVRDETVLAGEPGGSVVQASSAVDGKPVHLQPERYVSNSDVESAWAKQAASGCQVEVRLTDEGTEKLARLTRNHVGEKLALLIDGKVVMTPTIRSEITGGPVLLTGAFLDTGCEEIARGLAPSK